MTRTLPTLDQLAQQLEEGRVTAEALAMQTLERAEDAAGQGKLVFTRLAREEVLSDARWQDALRKRGAHGSRFAGIPMAVKDLFDLAGQVTKAGSKVLAGEAPAQADAPAIAALKQAGFVVMGRTNMTEFAYSGVGINSHYGTPLSVYDRKTGRIPGGSSSGSTVAVADGMAAIGIGSDTGGSCRIPAAYNGLVGYKPSWGRVSTKGVFPLAVSLDSIGPLGASVACCAAADALMAGDWDGLIEPRDVSSLTLGVFKGLPLDKLDPEVAAAFEQALSRLSARGARLVEFEFPEFFAELPELARNGGISSAEAHALHRRRLALAGDQYDPRVRVRLEAAAVIDAADYIHAVQRRAVLVQRFAERMAGLNGLLCPTVMNVPPPIAALADMPDYIRYNGMSLRNSALGNFLNACAISLPVHEPGSAPVGLMAMDAWGRDKSLFQVAAALEAALRK